MLKDIYTTDISELKKMKSRRWKYVCAFPRGNKEKIQTKHRNLNTAMAEMEKTRSHVARNNGTMIAKMYKIDDLISANDPPISKAAQSITAEDIKGEIEELEPTANYRCRVRIGDNTIRYLCVRHTDRSKIEVNGILSGPHEIIDLNAPDADQKLSKYEFLNLCEMQYV